MKSSDAVQKPSSLDRMTAGSQVPADAGFPVTLTAPDPPSVRQLPVPPLRRFYESGPW